MFKDEQSCTVHDVGDGQMTRILPWPMRAADDRKRIYASLQGILLRRVRLIDDYVPIVAHHHRLKARHAMTGAVNLSMNRHGSVPRVATLTSPFEFNSRSTATAA